MPAKPQPHPNPPELLRLGDVVQRTGLSRSEIYRRILAGAFPSPLKLARRIARWRAPDIDAWIADPVGYRADDQRRAELS